MRVGILTSGGDYQGLNATIRTIGKTFCEKFENDVAIFGIRDRYRGLMRGDYWEMSPRDFPGILMLGGAILGTSRQPFKEIHGPEDSQSEEVEQIKKNYKKLRLGCIVTLGSSDTHKAVNLLSEEGLSVITLSKTIDNDLWSTETTFDFSSAVEIASMIIDSIHSTATSHRRMFIMEPAGHKVSWLALHAGVAGGADAILLPEALYNIDSVSRTLQQRKRPGKQFSILAVAEGTILDKGAILSKKELKAQRAKMTEPSLSCHLAKEISEHTGNEVCVAIPGHFQRSDSPCPHDRALATHLGIAAAQMIQDRRFDCMMILQSQKIVPAPLGEVAGKLKAVPLGCGMIQSARDIGISFGD